MNSIRFNPIDLILSRLVTDDLNNFLNDIRVYPDVYKNILNTIILTAVKNRSIKILTYMFKHERRKFFKFVSNSKFEYFVLLVDFLNYEEKKIILKTTNDIQKIKYLIESGITSNEERIKMYQYLNFEFQNLRKIDEGAYGNIYSGEKDLNLYAIKITKLSEGLKESLILRSLVNKCHEFFLCYESHIISNGKILIITEYLRDYLNMIDAYNLGFFRQPNLHVGTVFMSINNAIKFLHENGIVHGDIKPDNIMMQGTRIKILDFGLSCVESSCSSVEIGGTLSFLDPMLLKNRGIKTFIDKKFGDIWSFGILIYTVINGFTPMKKFKSENKYYKKFSIETDEHKNIVNSYLSQLENFNAQIEYFLNPIPNQRHLLE